jgi:hypothetical protein
VCDAHCHSFRGCRALFLFLLPLLLLPAVMIDPSLPATRVANAEHAAAHRTIHGEERQLKVRAAPSRGSELGACRRRIWRACEKTVYFLEFPLCLSRACLGKMFVLCINGSKRPFFAHRASQPPGFVTTNRLQPWWRTHRTHTCLFTSVRRGGSPLQYIIGSLRQQRLCACIGVGL